MHSSNVACVAPKIAPARRSSRASADHPGRALATGAAAGRTAGRSPSREKTPLPSRSQSEDSEAEYVESLLAAHPALDVEEARWLWQRERSLSRDGAG